MERLNIMDMDTREQTADIRNIIRLMEEGKVSVSTETKWDSRQKSYFIESVILGLPLPPICVVCNEDGDLGVRAGKEQMNAIKEFAVDKTLELEDMEFYPELEGCTFDGIPRMFQRRLVEGKVTMYIIYPPTPENIQNAIISRMAGNQ